MQFLYNVQIPEVGDLNGGIRLGPQDDLVPHRFPPLIVVEWVYLDENRTVAYRSSPTA
jgi:hypothetical protein